LRILNVKNIVKKHNLPEEEVFQKLIKFMSQLEQKGKNKYFLLDTAGRRVFVIDVADIRSLTNGLDKLTFVDLLNLFNVDSKTMNWVLHELFEKHVINKKVLKYYTEVKDKPSIKAWFDPEEVIRDEETILRVKINAPEEIEQPKIFVDKPAGIELIEEPDQKSKILKGTILMAYKFRALRHGHYNVTVHLEGLVQGVRFLSEKVSSTTLKVKPFPPQISVNAVPEEVHASYNEECYVNLKIFNKGRGDANNVKIKGLENYPQFSILSETTVGNIPAFGRLEFPLVLLPKKSGFYKFENLILSYEDLDGNRFECLIPAFKINVTTPKPLIKLDLIAPAEVRSNQEFKLTVRITNLGDGKAKNVNFKLPIDQKLAVDVQEECFISELEEEKGTEKLEFTLRAPKRGEIVIKDFDLQFEDIEGKKMVRKCQGMVIKVSEIEKPYTRKHIPWPFSSKYPVKGKFKIVKEIGEGEFSKVFLVVDNDTGEKQALKALKPEFVFDSELVNDFLRGGAIAQSLREEHIVGVFLVDKEEFAGKAYPYIIMEYMEGGSLADDASLGKPRIFAKCINVIHDICSALVYAHQQGIVHCDVNPSNIFHDTKTDKWKLGDFNMAKIAFKGKVTLRRGAPWYAAPELRKGKGSYKSDVYSLGVVFRELLTGDPRGDLTILERIHRGVGSDVLRKITRLIDEMTSFDPAERPSMQEVLKIIREICVRTGLEYVPEE